jgi:transcriptional regulator NrdR family protein
MGRVHSRVRGGASHPCPLCSTATRVLRTTKIASTVQRHRQCPHCHHEYLTTERRAGEN